MTPEPGILAWIPTGGVGVHVEGECYRITPDDLRSLIFAGRPAPVTRERVRRAGNIIMGETAIEGHAAMNASGRAVMVHTRVGSYIVPLISLQRVARGEAVSAPLFPLVPGVTG